MKKRAAAIALVMAMVTASLAGCGQSKSSSASVSAGGTTSQETSVAAAEKVEAEVAATKGEKLCVGISADPVSLAPWVARSSGMIATYRTIYEYLVDVDELGGDIKGDLMESYEQVDDTTYNLKIYDYIYDTAGNHMTASDVVFSCMTAVNSGNLPKLSVIKDVTALDDYTVQFVFDRPLTLGELNAIWSEAPVVTQAAYESSPDGMATTPVGTTAYAIDKYVSGSEIDLKNTGNYWQKEELYAPYSYNNYDEIVFSVITEASQRTVAMETGAIDVCASIAKDDVSRFMEGGSDSENKAVSSYYDNKAMVLIPNCSESSVCSNLALRQAICYAIDAGQVLAGVYGDGKTLHTNAADVYGDYIEAWNNEEYYEYNLDKAKEKLAESGYNAGDLNLKIICKNQSDLVSGATIVQGFLMALGIKSEINAYEGAMYDTVAYDPSGYDIQINQKASTDYVVNVWKLDLDANSYGGHTYNFVENQELQDMLDTACSIEGHTDENIIALHNFIKENVFEYGLCNSMGYIVHTTDVDQVVFDTRKQIVPGCCKPAAK